MRRPGTSPSNDAPAPGLALRAASMIYEAVLLFGVSFIVSYALLAAMRWTYPLAGYQRWILQAVLFVVFGAYFVYCWTRSGQTLAMKSWHLRVVDRNGLSPSPATAILRYLLAWTLFLPGLILGALFPKHVGWDALALTASVVAMTLLGRAHAGGQLLHDRLLGTRVIREPRA
ncbi:MAG: RDD family protein [Gemmatimonadota bacterium]